MSLNQSYLINFIVHFIAFFTITNSVLFRYNQIIFDDCRLLVTFENSLDQDQVTVLCVCVCVCVCVCLSVCLSVRVRAFACLHIGAD